MASYKPPKVKDYVFTEEITHTLDRATLNYDNLIVAGDLNFDIADPSKSKPLMEICDLFDLKHLIKEPTCFKSDSGTIIDNFLSNRTSMFQKSGTLETGISDHHKQIYTVFICHLSKQSNKRISYRLRKL